MIEVTTEKVDLCSLIIGGDFGDRFTLVMLLGVITLLVIFYPF
jgi:hypothetical protein